MIVRAVLVAEGASDRRLARHLEGLCVACGADEATCDAPDLGALPRPPGVRTVDELRVVRELYPTANLLFVHRDADDPDPTPRREEIRAALASVGASDRGVAIVPVQMIESWLLTDEAAIRRAAGNPAGRVSLGLPAVRRLESVADPKALLVEAVRRAQEGRRRRRRVWLEQVRAALLDRISADDDVLQQLPSWRQLRDDITAQLAARRSG